MVASKPWSSQVSIMALTISTFSCDIAYSRRPTAWRAFPRSDQASMR
jgi:hypothetical protein